MRMAIVNPGCDTKKVLGGYGRLMAPFPPMGVASLAAVLEKAGHDVLVIDQYALGIPAHEVVMRVAAHKPMMVGLSCLTTAMPMVENLSQGIRAVLPEASIALGNIHASFFSESLLKRKIGDFVIHGEGENAFLKLADCLDDGKTPENIPGVSWLNEGTVIYNGPAKQVEDLDSLPFPAWHLLPWQKYMAHPIFGRSGIMLPILASRGCPYECFFCTQKTPFRKVRVRNAEKVADEMEYLKERFGVRITGFMDCIFPVTEETGRSLTAAITGRGLQKKLSWCTELRVDSADLDLLSRMKDAGLFHVAFGVETGDPEMLRGLGKKFTIETVRQAIKNAKTAGLGTVCFFVLGFPGETAASCRKTINLALELDPDFAKFNIAIPYPGSRFFDDWWDGRMESIVFHKFSAWFSPQKGDTILHVPDAMTQNELLACQRKAMAAFWLRPSKIIHHLCKGTISPGVMWKGFTALAADTACSILGIS